MNTLNRDKKINLLEFDANGYDIIIIGAGIGGLICGCYLAKGGQKVLLIEKNFNPGGYCCNFRRGPFKFDVGVHYLGSLRQNGQLETIFKELTLDKDIEIKRYQISDILYDSELAVKVSADLKDTIENFKQAFPEELPQKVEAFFNFVNESSVFSIIRISQDLKSFDDLLNKYFKRQKIKNFLLALLGNTGSLSNVHLIPATILFKEFILDGGYYPYGGFGELSYALVKKFKYFGGEYLFNNEVEEILVDENIRAVGVVSKNKGIIKAESIISNCDISHTFKYLIRDKKYLIDSTVFSKEHSQSVFVVYLGLDEIPEKIKKFGKFGGLWFIPKEFSTFNANPLSDKALDITKNQSLNGPFFMAIPTFLDDTLAPTSKHIMRIQIVASFKSKNYWNRNKKIITEVLLTRVENCFGSLRDKIIEEHVATPYDFYRYTYNKKGATVGWAPTIHNYNIKNIKINLKNFYQVGHWCNLVGVQGGVSMAALTGKLVAQKILK